MHKVYEYEYWSINLEISQRTLTFLLAVRETDFTWPSNLSLESMIMPNTLTCSMFVITSSSFSVQSFQLYLKPININ